MADNISKMDDSKPKVTLHWLEISRAQRIVWLLEECKGLDYELKLYKRGDDKMADPALKKIHPLGKSPVITLEAPTLTEPLVIAESALIIEYLCDHFATHLIPKRYQDGKEGLVGGETESWLRYRYFMHYAEGSLMTLLVLALFMSEIPKNSPFFIKPIARAITKGIDDMFLNANLNLHLRFLEKKLATSPNDGSYLCGEQLTAADILMSFPLQVYKPKIQKQSFPKLMDYIARLENNEVYKRSIKKVEEINGGPLRDTF